MDFLTSKTALTLLVVLISLVLKVLMIKFIKRTSRKDGIDRRLYINTFRNIINLLVVILAFYIWHVELREFAFSIAAFIVAIVLATRELIHCFIGFIYLSSTTTFRIGNWIQVGNYVGEVTATDWAKVTLLEVDPHSYSYTGKTVFLPNSMVMSHPIKNLNFMRRYVHHAIEVIKNDNVSNPFFIKQALLDKANHYCEEFKEVAERYNQVIEKGLDISLSGTKPSVEFTSTDLGKIRITVTIFCPTEQLKDLEQAITEDIYSLWETIKVSGKNKEAHDE